MIDITDQSNSISGENDRIKVFLKIKKSLPSDKKLLSLSNDKKIITLFDENHPEEPEKGKIYELDKIFDKDDVNSYIYEEIMRDCIQNSLEGTNFTFLTYGDSLSEKDYTIIGTPESRENITMRGLYPRLLDSYINKIDNDDVLVNNLSIYLSYIMINGNNLIDLAQLIGKNIEELTYDNLFKKYSRDINITDFNILRHIKKVPCENANDPLFFLIKFFNALYKMEQNNKNILSWSTFSFIIYIMDNNGKTISNINFIILPGNEDMIGKSGTTDLVKDSKKPNEITMKKQLFDFANTSESILFYMDAQSFEDDEIFENLKINKYNIKNSKLLFILGKLSFDTENPEGRFDRKYLVLGTIWENSGLIANIKDTLFFLFQCKKLTRKKLNQESLNSLIKHEKMKKKRTKYLDKEQLNKELEEKVKSKDEQITDLESKLKAQEAKLNELSTKLEQKEGNIKALQINYKQQIETLKQLFSFPGDLEVLTQKDPNSEEVKYGLLVRNTMENNRLKETKIEELKNQLKKLEGEKLQFKNSLNIIQNDVTMVDIVRTVKKGKEQKKEETKEKNTNGHILEMLKKENEILNKKLVEFTKECNHKNDIIKNLPNFLSSNIDNFSGMLTPKLKGEKVKKINTYETNSIQQKKTEMKELEKSETEENEKIKKKYENLVLQKRKELKKENQNFLNFDNFYKKKKTEFINEMTKLFNLYTYLINQYNKIFFNGSSVFIQKIDFQKILDHEDTRMNCFSYPLLYEELGKRGYNYMTISKKANNLKTKKDKKFLSEEKISDIKDLNENKINLDLNINKEEFFENVKKNKVKGKQFSNYEIEKAKNKIFSDSFIKKKSEEELNNMNREELKEFVYNFPYKIEEIEKFVNKYIIAYSSTDIIDNSNNDITDEKEKQILSEINKISNDKFNLLEKINKLNVVTENSKKIISKLTKENNYIKSKIKERNSKFNYPVITCTGGNNYFNYQKGKFEKTSQGNVNRIKSLKGAFIEKNKINETINYNENHKVSITRPITSQKREFGSYKKSSFLDKQMLDSL